MSKYGYDPFSAPSFCAYGFVKNLLGKYYDEGAKYADRALQLLEMMPDNKRTASRSLYISWFLVYPRSKPIHSTFKHLLRGYKVGMEVGDCESAMWSVSMYQCSSIVAGKSLQSLAVDCSTYIEQMKALKQDYIVQQTLPFHQFALNMLGNNTEDPTKLNGLAMTEKGFLAMIEDSQGREASFLHFKIMKSMMCNFFNDYEQGAKLALERGDTYEKKNGSPLAMVDFLHQAISLYAMGRKTGEKRYIKAAKKVKKHIATWAKKGNVNVLHYIPFLEAEEAALYGKSDSTSQLYMQAIS